MRSSPVLSEPEVGDLRVRSNRSDVSDGPGIDDTNCAIGGVLEPKEKLGVLL